MKPIVSVIIPIYNAEKYLSKCIDSIINQTLKNIEIILINDGSTDNTKEIINRYLEIDERIRVINKKNSGPAKSRNLGIEIASGKYIGFVDADDYVDNTMYEKLVYLATNNEAQLTMCNYRDVTVETNIVFNVNHNLEVDKLKNHKYIREHIIKTFTTEGNYGFFSMCNKIYLRTWIKEINLVLDESRDHGEDWWFNINAFMRLERFACTDESLYFYIHTNKESLISKYRENQFNLCLDGRIKLLSTIPPEFINYDSLNKRFVYEFSDYIFRTLQCVKEKSKRENLIDNVINNEEVKKCCKSVKKIPLHLQIISLFIALGWGSLAKISYKAINLLR